MRRYVYLVVLCAALMLGLAAHSPLVHPLWRLSFVPEAAAQQELTGTPAPSAQFPPGRHN